MKKQIKKLLCAALVFTMATGAFAACGTEDDEPVDSKPQTNETKYNDACALIENGEYEEAYAAFKALGDYKDSQERLSRFIYTPSRANYVLEDRSGVMTIELGKYNLPSRVVSVGVEGEEDNAYTKDSVYTYDDKGNLMQQAVTYNESSLAYDYTYDADNRLIKAVYTIEGELFAQHNFVYDENGLKIREDYIQEGQVYYDYVYSYDDNDNVIECVYDATEGRYTYAYFYDAEGALTNDSGEAPDGYYYTNEYTYYADGQLAQRVCVENGELSFTESYTYDNAGELIKKETTYSDGTKDVYTREYDANGNLVKETLVYADGTEESIEWQYIFTYIPIDVPAATREQVEGIFVIIQP